MNIKTLFSMMWCAGAFFIVDGAQAQSADGLAWERSFEAGYVDDHGAYAGGSEIMHIVSHQGKLFAANGYWVDAKWVIPPDGEKQSAQVLRLDEAGGTWQVDLDLGRSNDDLPLMYMKGNILKSLTFTRDAGGHLLPNPVQRLVMVAGANFERGGAVSAWVRNDESSVWTHTLVRHGSNASGVRWVPRDMEVYQDKVTGQELLLLSLGNPGIISGVYDAEVPGEIRWSRHLEYPFPEAGTFAVRPLGMVEANGALFISEGSAIYRRLDGKHPTYEQVYDLYEDADTDIGGIRGLSVIPNPMGKGQSLIFLWAPAVGSQSEIMRMDPDGRGGYKVVKEVSLAERMQERLGVEVPYTLGAHNMMYPMVSPETGETVHLIGFQGNIRGKHELRWSGCALYAGAQYAVRGKDQQYTILEVNNTYTAGKTPLITPRAFCLSPFGDHRVYMGGHDASRHLSDNMAWIFSAPINVVLGQATAADAPPARPKTAPEARWLTGPLYELRIYEASEGRHRDLIKRFREHTDGLFKKHGMEPMGYWIPTDGSYKQKRKFVYVLQHPSRYAAYQNWIKFSTDAEWEAVLDRPEYKGLLSERPVSIFMTENEYSAGIADTIDQAGGVYELRTYVTNSGKLPLLNRRFKQHTTRLFNQHGIKNVGYWTPYDQPEAGDHLIYLIQHASREQADENWGAFQQDPIWKKVARESQAEGKFLAERPARLYLRALDFSPLR